MTVTKKVAEDEAPTQAYTEVSSLVDLMAGLLPVLHADARNGRTVRRAPDKAVVPANDPYVDVQADAFIQQLKEAASRVVKSTSEGDTETMDSVSREELDAKLAANVAEVKSVASEMRAEMAGLRSENAIQFSALKEQLTALQAAIETRASQTDAKVETLSAKVDGVEKGIEGKIDGVKTAISTTQWVITVVVAVAALPGFVSFFSKEEPKPSAPAVVVVQQPTAPVPQGQPAPAVKPAK